jgi:hypothetical protein
MAKTSARKTFKTKLIGQGPGGAWTRIDVPFNVEDAWGSRARVSVMGTINGFAFRSSIFPGGRGTHHMMVNKAMKDGAAAGPGDSVTVTIEPDTEKRTVPIPADLKRAVQSNRTAAALFEALSPSCRKEYVDWIQSAKREQTRTSRIAKAVEMLAAGKRRLE